MLKDLHWYFQRRARRERSKLENEERVPQRRAKNTKRTSNKQPRIIMAANVWPHWRGASDLRNVGWCSSPRPVEAACWAASLYVPLFRPLLHVNLDLSENGGHVAGSHFGYEIISHCGRSRALDKTGNLVI